MLSEARSIKFDRLTGLVPLIDPPRIHFQVGLNYSEAKARKLYSPPRG